MQNQSCTWPQMRYLQNSFQAGISMVWWCHLWPRWRQCGCIFWRQKQRGSKPRWAQSHPNHEIVKWWPCLLLMSFKCLNFLLRGKALSRAWAQVHYLHSFGPRWYLMKHSTVLHTALSKLTWLKCMVSTSLVSWHKWNITQPSSSLLPELPIDD